MQGKENKPEPADVVAAAPAAKRAKHVSNPDKAAVPVIVID